MTFPTKKQFANFLRKNEKKNIYTYVEDVNRTCCPLEFYLGPHKYVVSRSSYLHIKSLTVHPLPTWAYIFVDLVDYKKTRKTVTGKEALKCFRTACEKPKWPTW